MATFLNKPRCLGLIKALPRSLSSQGDPNSLSYAVWPLVINHAETSKNPLRVAKNERHLGFQHDPGQLSEKPTSQNGILSIPVDPCLSE